MKGSMKCTVFYGKNNIKVETRPIPQVKDSDVLVKVKACGICGTDLGMYNGRIAYKEEAVGKIFGHELTGVIQERGEKVTDYQIEDRVVIMPTFSCGKCFYCKTGNENLCPNRIDIGDSIDGGYAEYIRVPQKLLFRLPDKVGFEEGTLLADCVPTPIHAIGKFAGIKVGDRVAVWGTGGQGYCALQIAKLNGANVTVVGRRKEKLKLAKEIGADFTIDIESEDVLQRIKELTDGRRVDISIEAAGYPKAITQALACVRPGGRVIVVGLQKPQLCDLEDMGWNEKSIIGSQWTTEPDFNLGVRLAGEGKLKLKPLVTHTFSMDQIEKAFNLLTERKEMVIKVVIKP